MYTTLSPCPMCSGTILLFGIPRVVIGENVNFVGSEALLADQGVEIIQANNSEIQKILGQFIADNKELWFEDISELDQ